MNHEAGTTLRDGAGARTDPVALGCVQQAIFLAFMVGQAWLMCFLPYADGIVMCLQAAQAAMQALCAVLGLVRYSILGAGAADALGGVSPTSNEGLTAQENARLI